MAVSTTGLDEPREKGLSTPQVLDQLLNWHIGP